MHRVLLYDTTDRRLSPVWAAGAALSGIRSRRGVSSWDDAIDQLARWHHWGGGMPLDVQLWGHGRAGQILIDGEPLKLDGLTALVPSGQMYRFWARSCETIKGARGKAWARDFVAATGADYVGHTQVTNLPNPLFQRGCAALVPGQEPWWSDEGEELCKVFTLRHKVPGCAYLQKARVRR